MDVFSQAKDHQCETLTGYLETYHREVSIVKAQQSELAHESRSLQDAFVQDIGELQQFFTRIVCDLTREIDILRVEKRQAVSDRELLKTENKLVHQQMAKLQDDLDMINADFRRTREKYENTLEKV